MASSALSLDRIAFSDGYAACRAGKSNIDNPYIGRGEDGLEEAWNEGWFERCDDEAEAVECRMDF